MTHTASLKNILILFCIIFSSICFTAAMENMANQLCNESFYESSILDFSQDSNEFEVECVLDRRQKNGHLEYLLKWKNYDHSHNRWTSSDKLNCNTLIMDFERRKRKRVRVSFKSNVPKWRRLNSGQSDDAPVMYRSADESGSQSETSILNTSFTLSQPSTSVPQPSNEIPIGILRSCTFKYFRMPVELYWEPPKFTCTLF